MIFLPIYLSIIFWVSWIHFFFFLILDYYNNEFSQNNILKLAIYISTFFPLISKQMWQSIHCRAFFFSQTQNCPVLNGNLCNPNIINIGWVGSKEDLDLVLWQTEGSPFWLWWWMLQGVPLKNGNLISRGDPNKARTRTMEWHSYTTTPTCCCAFHGK